MVTKQERAAQKRAYNAANAAHIAEQKRAYYQANKARISARQQAYREAHKEQYREWQRNYRANNPEKRKAADLKASRKAHGVVGAHGESRQGPCEICAAECKLVLDHCHTTGKIRGWLCDACNRGLGCFRDTLDTVRKAARYLENKHHEQ